MKNSKYEEQKKPQLSGYFTKPNDGVEVVGTASGPRTAVHILFCAEQKNKKQKTASSSTQILG